MKDRLLLKIRVSYVFILGPGGLPRFLAEASLVLGQVGVGSRPHPTGLPWALYPIP